VKIAIVTDAWTPQVNGVVTTLVDLSARLYALGHEVEVIEPAGFRRMRCPGYAEIELAWGAGDGVRRRLDAAAPDAIHIATAMSLGPDLGVLITYDERMASAATLYGLPVASPS